jgi:hypothetical protein
VLHGSPVDARQPWVGMRNRAAPADISTSPSATSQRLGLTLRGGRRPRWKHCRRLLQGTDVFVPLLLAAYLDSHRLQPVLRLEVNTTLGSGP